MFTYSNNIALHLPNSKQAQELYEKAFNMKFQSEDSDGIHMKSGAMNFWLDQSKGEPLGPPETFFEYFVENGQEAKTFLESLGFVMKQTTLKNCFMMKDPYHVNWHIYERARGKGIVDTIGFNLTTIYVDDFKKCEQFYIETLGFSKTEDMGDGALYTVGIGLQSTMIYLEGGAKKQIHTKENPVSKTCICLRAPSIKKAAEQLKSAGIEFYTEYHETSETFAMFNVLDPAGNVIEYAGNP